MGVNSDVLNYFSGYKLHIVIELYLYNQHVSWQDLATLSQARTNNENKLLGKMKLKETPRSLSHGMQSEM